MYAQFQTLYLLFSDDLKLYVPINSTYSSNKFQADLYSWCLNNRPNVNISKCTQITFTARRAYERINYNIGDRFVIVVPHVKDLGIIFSSTFSFVNYIHMISDKATAYALGLS